MHFLETISKTTELKVAKNALENLGRYFYHAANFHTFLQKSTLNYCLSRNFCEFGSDISRVFIFAIIQRELQACIE